MFLPGCLLASDKVQYWVMVEPLPTKTGGLSDGNLNIFWCWRAPLLWRTIRKGRREGKEASVFLSICKYSELYKEFTLFLRASWWQMSPSAWVWSTWCSAAWRMSSVWLVGSWQLITLMGRERWRSISGPLVFPWPASTWQPTLKTFSLYGSPRKPLMEITTPWVSGICSESWPDTCCPPFLLLCTVLPLFSGHTSFECLLCAYLCVKCWEGYNIVLNFTENWFLDWKQRISLPVWTIRCSLYKWLSMWPQTLVSSCLM